MSGSGTSERSSSSSSVTSSEAPVARPPCPYTPEQFGALPGSGIQDLESGEISGAIEACKFFRGRVVLIREGELRPATWRTRSDFLPAQPISPTEPGG